VKAFAGIFLKRALAAAPLIIVVMSLGASAPSYAAQAAKPAAGPPAAGPPAAAEPGKPAPAPRAGAGRSRVAVDGARAVRGWA